MFRNHPAICVIHEARNEASGNRKPWKITLLETVSLQFVRFYQNFVSLCTRGDVCAGLVNNTLNYFNYKKRGEKIALVGQKQLREL